MVTHPCGTQIQGWVSHRPGFDVGMRSMPWRSGAFSSLPRQTTVAEVGACLLPALPMPFNGGEQEWVGRHSLWTRACWDVSGGVVPGTWLLLHHLRALTVSWLSPPLLRTERSKRAAWADRKRVARLSRCQEPHQPLCIPLCLWLPLSWYLNFCFHLSTLRAGAADHSRPGECGVVLHVVLFCVYQAHIGAIVALQRKAGATSVLNARSGSL